MEETKGSLQNLLILAALMVAGFFLPLGGLIGMILFLINNPNSQSRFTKDEKTMAILGTIVLGIYWGLTIIYSLKFPTETPETSSELLRLLLLI